MAAHSLPKFTSDGNNACAPGSSGARRHSISVSLNPFKWHAHSTAPSEGAALALEAAAAAAAYEELFGGERQAE